MIGPITLHAAERNGLLKSGVKFAFEGTNGPEPEWYEITQMTHTRVIFYNDGYECYVCLGLTKIYIGEVP